MKPVWIRVLPLSLVIAGAVSLHAQTLSDEIEQAHGGPALAQLAPYQVQGRVELTDRGGETRTLPFVLKVSGDRSRLEIEGKVLLRQGIFGQGWQAGGPRSSARRVWEGRREVYLLPFFAVGRLRQYQLSANPPAGPRFERTLVRRTHFGYHAKTPYVELQFDPGSRLLTRAVFGTREGGQTPVVITYSNYTRTEGLALPQRVVRQVGDNPPEVFFIEAVHLHTSFSPQEFQIEF